MKSPVAALTTVLLALSVSSVSAQSSGATSTISITPGCPSAAPGDVIVTRSNVPVPSCAAGSNATKPSIISMSGSMASGSATGTMTAGTPQFTGAAGRFAVDGMVALVGMGVVGLFV